MTAPSTNHGNGNGRTDPFAFMTAVRAACSTPAGRADLRNGLNTVLADLEQPHGSDTDHTGTSRWPLYTHLMARGYQPPATTGQETPYLLVAALYATHDAPNPRTSETAPPPPLPHTERWENLGWTYATACHRGAMRDDAAAGLLGYFTELDQATLLRELPAAISRLRSAAIPVRWPLLLRDLLRWPGQLARIRLDWARSFHNTPAAKEN